MPFFTKKQQQHVLQTISSTLFKYEEQNTNITPKALHHNMGKSSHGKLE
jgi:MarR-like DNA-binding transcriptional regulator SgrR of sgrS sRNA